MSSGTRKNITLFTEIHTKQILVSRVFSNIRISNSESIDLSAQSGNFDAKSNLFSVTYVPDYMETKVRDSSCWTERIFQSVNGYAIKLESHSSADEYLRQHNRKQRENMKRALSRLEICFNTGYKFFDSSITEEEHLSLMEHLKVMILKRFKQRGEKSESIRIWDKVLHTSFNLVKRKKASLFVIYDKDVPIAISFNYHYNKILFGYISSYDIDYHKFSLGNLLIYKQLDWCLENGYNHFDMGWGDMKYKKWWSNTLYFFNHHIIYRRNSIPGFLWALYHGNKTRFFAFLISKGINTHSKKIKKLLSKRERKPKSIKEYKFEDFLPSLGETINQIDLQTKNSPITKRIINDFLFITKEHSNDITLHYENTKDLYILKGKKSVKAILFNLANQ